MIFVAKPRISTALAVKYSSKLDIISLVCEIFEINTPKSMIKQERIDVADVLRGLAVLGIVLLHSLEHFNFYSYPETENTLLQFTNKAIWDSTTFLLAGKAYGIFALLFGFSFYIQDRRQLDADAVCGPITWAELVTE